MNRAIIALAAFSALTGVACDLGDLSQESDLDRTRVLAVRTTPAEVAPGALVTFEALSFAPAGELEITWTLDGVGEFGTGHEVQFPVPEDILVGLPPFLIARGFSLPIEIKAWVEDDDDVETAIKHVRVSQSPTPNLNPSIEGLLVDETPVDSSMELVVQVGETYAFEVLPTEEAAEEYVYVTTEGVSEDRTEELDHRWYASIGDFEGGFGSGGAIFGNTTHKSTWVAPEEAATGVLIVVTADGRGGMTWHEIPLRAQ